MTTEREDLIYSITICPTDTDVGSTYTAYAGPIADILMELKDEIQGLRERVMTFEKAPFTDLKADDLNQRMVDLEQDDLHQRLLVLEKAIATQAEVLLALRSPPTTTGGNLSVSDVTVLLDTVLGARK